MLKQLLDFPRKEKNETMDRLVIIQGQKLLKQRLDFRIEETIETMDTLAIIQRQKIVEPMVRFSNWREAWHYG